MSNNKTLSTGSSWIWSDTVDPGVSETNVSQGNLYLNTSSNNIFICKVATIGLQVWDRYAVATVTVANGGTGQTTLAAHGLVVGNGSSGVNVLATGATGTVLSGVTGSDPAFTASPALASITLGGGNSLANYVQGTWTPVLAGTVAAGAGTYSSQVGYYTRIGNVVFGWLNLVWSATTGTGDTLITGLPVAASASVSAVCSFQFQSITLPVGGLLINGRISGTQMALVSPITAAVEAPVVLPAAGNVQASFAYMV